MSLPTEGFSAMTKVFNELTAFCRSLFALFTFIVWAKEQLRIAMKQISAFPKPEFSNVAPQMR
jgi:hypothetical protein